MPQSSPSLLFVLVLMTLSLTSCGEGVPKWQGREVKLLATQPISCESSFEMQKNESGNYGVIRFGTYQVESLGVVMCVGQRQLVTARGQMYFPVPPGILISSGTVNAITANSIDIDAAGSLLHLSISEKTQVCAYRGLPVSEQLKTGSVVTVTSLVPPSNALSIRPGPLLISVFDQSNSITGYGCDK